MQTSDTMGSKPIASMVPAPQSKAASTSAVRSVVSARSYGPLVGVEDVFSR